jgi:ABC-type multidrug transport system fused ATPase/permease subunit
MSSHGSQQNNNRLQSSPSTRGRGNSTKKSRGANNNVDYEDRGRGASRGRPYKRESMVAKPTVLIKGTPTILGAKQIQQEQADQQDQISNNQPQVMILSPNNTSASVTTQINATNSPVKKSPPPPVIRLLQPQDVTTSTTTMTPKSPIQILKAPSPQPQASPLLLQRVVPPPNKCLKFMTENLDILTEQVTKILSSTAPTGDSVMSDFTVIGILGEQGVGKSTIVNEIARVCFITAKD